jgi:hypothetical protein
VPKPVRPRPELTATRWGSRGENGCSEHQRRWVRPKTHATDSPLCPRPPDHQHRQGYVVNALEANEYGHSRQRRLLPPR